MRPYHVAIVGSGPSGFFAAASLLNANDASDQIEVVVDMLEMLPTPWCLVRSGVAPDHPKVKSVSRQFDKIAADSRVRFFGNLRVGEHVQAAELAERYDAVVDPAQLEGISDGDAAAAGKIAKQNITALRDYASRAPRFGHRRIMLRFFTSPIEIKGDGMVESIVLGRNGLVSAESGRMGQRHRRKRGTTSSPGSAFGRLPRRADTRAAVRRQGRDIPNTAGRVAGRRNECVVGWIKRGPTGVIGTNKLRIGHG